MKIGAWTIFEDAELRALGTSMQDIRDGKQPIARAECAMLPFTMLEEADLFFGREVLWFVDNTAALNGTVKGTSSEPISEKLIALFWSLSYRLRAHIWLEFVDSGSNWADGISRDYDQDTFSREHGFSTRRVYLDMSWATKQYDDLWTDCKRLGRRNHALARFSGV